MAHERLPEIPINSLDDFKEHILGENKQPTETQVKITWDIAFEAGKQEERKRFKELCAHCDTPLIKEGERYEAIKQEERMENEMRLNDRLLTKEEIGDLLDLDKEYTYPCSDGSETTTIACHQIAQAQLTKAEPLIRADEKGKALREVGEWLRKQRANTGKEIFIIYDAELREFDAGRKP